AAAVPGLAIESITPMDIRVQRNLGPHRLMLLLTSAFGVLALGLAGLGLFGVLSYTVSRRRSEFGIRMALGASRSRVVWSVVNDGLKLVGYGFLIGFPAVLICGRLVSTLFFGISPYDGTTLALAAVTLLTVGVGCGLLPALRASRV